jgi:hypothetical protein
VGYAAQPLVLRSGTCHLLLVRLRLRLHMQAVRCMARTTTQLPAIICCACLTTCCVQGYQIMISWV